MKINLAIFQQEEYGNIVCGWVGDRGSDFCVFSIIEINTNQVKVRASEWNTKIEH